MLICPGIGALNMRLEPEGRGSGQRVEILVSSVGFGRRIWASRLEFGPQC